MGRVTLEVDTSIPIECVDDFLNAAPFCWFDVRNRREGRWPKLLHRETGIEVDVLPEGGRPGTAARPAPTTIPHPRQMGAVHGA
jgi:hypothetical protein